MASAAEQLIQRGKQEGLRHTFTRLLRSRFGTLATADEERIAKAEPETLERWLDRILTAESADDVFDAE